MSSVKDVSLFFVFFFFTSIEINQAFSTTRKIITSTLSDSDSSSCYSRGLINSLSTSDFISSFDYENSDLSIILPKLNITTNYKNHLVSGLSMNQVQERLQIYGTNVLTPKPRRTWLKLYADQFEDTLVRILLLVALISLVSSSVSEIQTMISSHEHLLDWRKIFHNLMEPLVILLILVLNASMGVWQTIRATKSLEAIEKMQPRLATVLRTIHNSTTSSDANSSKWVTGADASSLVPGDVIRIKAGDQVPADARIVYILSSSLSIDESSLTGESLPVYKWSEEEKADAEEQPSRCSKMAFAGSMVIAGSAECIIIKTGMNTEIGKIHESVSSTADGIIKTPLGEQLDKLGQKLSQIIGVMCLLVWAISIPHFSDPTFSSKIEAAIYYAKVAVALGVAAIPEGLPAIVSLTLSLGTRRMAESNVIVKTLSSVETLGCTTVICSDKTGTLTLNRQTVVSLMLFHEDERGLGALMEHSVSGSSYNPQGFVENIQRAETSLYPNGAVSDLCQIMVLCNDARLVASSHGNETKYNYEGDPTEAALLVLAEKLGKECDSHYPANIRVEYNRKLWSEPWKKWKTLDFDRERKSMSVICHSMVDCSMRIFVKGAPDTMLQRCTFIKSTNGTIFRINQSMRKELEARISQMSSRPLRCLLIAFKNVDDKTGLMNETKNYVDIERDLILVGVTGLIDPPRADVSSSLSECKDAGIRVVMITGDNKDTARAVAHDIGIIDIDQVDRVFDAVEFFSLEPSRQEILIKSGNLVFSRTKPLEKQFLVEKLQSNGEVVAMTGDGVNDAPALKKASIGVAMGSGTDVAKETADMILMDDSFSSIVRAVAEGRSIYSNMRAFINFLLSCNLGEVFAVALASMLGLPSMLTAPQLLWVNLITDGPPAIALGFNPPDKELMKKPPRAVEEEFIDNAVALRYTISGAYIALATNGIFIYYLHSPDCMEKVYNTGLCDDLLSHSRLQFAQTVALSTLACTELLKALSSVSTASLFKISPLENKYLIASVAGSLCLHVLLMYSPSILSESLGLVPITINDWILILGFSFPILVLEEILKVQSKK